MQDNLQMFKNEIFHITALTLGNEPIFLPSELEEQFGYRDLAHSIGSSDSLVKGVDYLIIVGDSLRKLKELCHKSGKNASVEIGNNVKSLLVLTESGLYALAFRSDKETMKRFRIWITKEVIPQIRKTGNYYLPNDQQNLVHNAKEILADSLSIANLLEVPKHLGMIESVKEVKKLTGIDYQPLLLQSSVMNNIPQEEEYLEPTELGKLFDKSAKEMNLILEELGLQVKVSGVWNPTKLGKKYSLKHAWSIGTKSGYNYKWQVKEIRKRLDNYSLEL